MSTLTPTQAHHLIPNQLRGHDLFQALTALRPGTTVATFADAPRNLLHLPTANEASGRLGAAVHNGRHDPYTAFVESRLDAVFRQVMGPRQVADLANLSAVERRDLSFRLDAALTETQAQLRAGLVDATSPNGRRLLVLNSDDPEVTRRMQANGLSKEQAISQIFSEAQMKTFTLEQADRGHRMIEAFGNGKAQSFAALDPQKMNATERAYIDGRVGDAVGDYDRGWNEIRRAGGLGAYTRPAQRLGSLVEGSWIGRLIRFLSPLGTVADLILGSTPVADSTRRANTRAVDHGDGHISFVDRATGEIVLTVARNPGGSVRPIMPGEPDTPPAVGQSAPRCFLPGTPILMADGSERPIEQVRVGDQVMSFDPGVAGGRGPLAPARVSRTFQNTTRVVVDLRGTRMTPGHVCLTEDGRFETIAHILERDGALVDKKGHLLRARTGARLGSLDDAPVRVAYTDPHTGQPHTALVRAGIPAGTLPDASGTPTPDQPRRGAPPHRPRHPPRRHPPHP